MLCWAGQCFTMLCLRQTVQTLLCSPSSGLPALLPYREYGSTPEEAADVCVCVCVCVRVCVTNVGQAVIKLGSLSMTSQTVNRSFSLQVLYTAERKTCPSFRLETEQKRSSGLHPVRRLAFHSDKMFLLHILNFYISCLSSSTQRQSVYPEVLYFFIYLFFWIPSSC